MKNVNLETIATNATTRDDSYNTRQHAFNIGLAYGAVCAVICVCSVIAFHIEGVWLMRGLLLSLVIGVIAFAKALIDFTQEARDIQWQTHIPPIQMQAQQPMLIQEDTLDRKRASFPHPAHRNGMLFTDIELTDEQRNSIAQSVLQHGKLTINYLIGIGLRREDAELLREELVSHNLLMFNERNEAVLTEDGERSFAQLTR